MENEDLNKFYTNLREDINSTWISEEEGANPEQIFTGIALSYLADAGETENYSVCFDEKVTGRGIVHKLNGYSLYENYETLDLFVTIYNPDSSVQRVPKPEAQKAIERALKFFRNAIYGDYVNEIEKSSEIHDIAHTLSKAPEVKEYLSRVNIFLITNGFYDGDLESKNSISGFNIFYRTIDINYLFNLSDKSRVPIEIDFSELGFDIPCIANETKNSEYQCWLAIIPGEALARIYEKYGARLLEQNVRSFLQFTGKINKGIKSTILENQKMFMAYNNGIAATANEISLSDSKDGKGRLISKVKDLQIVNGGQTTASIYHTWKKEKEMDISQVFVPVKLTIIRNKDKFSEIVGNIAEYANTQNKVSAADLTSNRENYILLEKLSRVIWAPLGESGIQTRWFFERSRGQYKNDRNRQLGAKQKKFDKQNPRSQMFTKEALAKYINTYGERIEGGNKIVIGPHIVVKGASKNYAIFLSKNFKDKPDNYWFEDAIAKAILWRKAEKAYGVKPNAIGSMRFITVPYSIAWIAYKLEDRLDLYKIWKKQTLDDNFRQILREIMIKIDDHIKETAPGSLTSEWAKKEECWNSVKNSHFGIDIKRFDSYLIDETAPKRLKLTEEVINNKLIAAEIEVISGIPAKKWQEIGNATLGISSMTILERNKAVAIGAALATRKELNSSQRKDALNIIDKILDSSPSFFDNLSNDSDTKNTGKKLKVKITPELIQKMIVWDDKAKVLTRGQIQYISLYAYGERKLNSFHIDKIQVHLVTLQNAGFRP